MQTLAGLPVYRTNDPGAVAPSPINFYSVLSIPAYWRAINFIADNLASFPRSVHRDGAKPGDAHPLDAVLRRRPNGYQNPFIFWRALYAHAAHHGNGFAEVKRTPTGRVDSLHNLCPEDVTPFRYSPDDATGVQQFYVVGAGPARRVLPGADVVHLTGLSYDGMCGLDPVCLFSETFQRARTLDRFQTRYLAQGTVMRGSIEIPTAATDEQIEQIIGTIKRHFNAANGDRDVIVLSGGAKLNNATLSPQESQVVQQGAATTKAIAQITGVPPEFLYELSEAKYNASVEQAGQTVVRYTFRPWIEQAEDELTAKLLTLADQDAGYAVRINPDALLRGDTAAVNAAVTTTVNAGLRTRNEGRALLDLPPDPDPASDTLRTLGDTTPQAARAAAPANTQGNQ